jgi:NAD(P)-dependent dehydrogenase (short-subunit alcohol dehydrogenase family)
MRGRICLVTGATSGIGAATATELARLGATIIVHGRDEARCKRTVATIRALDQHPIAEYIVADFASLDSVRAMADELHHRFDRLHILVNNAGAMFPDRRESADGHELTFAVNHLAPFLLTNLLLDLLRTGAPSRVVNVASGAHRRAVLDFLDLESRKSYDPRDEYGRSKLMNVLFTRELARRLAGSGVTVNALSPGIVHTEFGVKDGMGPDQQAVMDKGKSPEEGARTSVYVASDPGLETASGGYYQDSAPFELGENALDDEAARRLWEISAELVGLDPDSQPTTPRARRSSPPAPNA